MSNGTVDRDVVIRLRLLNSPESKAAVDECKAAIDAINDAASAGAKKRRTNADKAASDELESQEKTLKSLDNQRQRAFQKEAIEQEKTLKALDDQRQKAFQKEAHDQQRAADQLAKDQQRAADQLAKQRDKAYQDEFRAQEKASENARVAAESAAANQVAAGKATQTAMKSALSGAIQLGQGLAQLGILGKTDVEGLARGFIQVQAAVNMLKGAIDVFQGIRDSARQAREMVLLTAQANALLAASQRGIAGTAVSGGVASGASGAAGKAASGLAGNVAGGVIAGGLAARMPTLYGLGSIALGGAAAVGTGALALGGGLLGGEALSRAATGGRNGTVSELMGLIRDLRKNSSDSDKFSKLEESRSGKLALAAERDGLISENAQRSAEHRVRQEESAQRMDSTLGTEPKAAARNERLRAIQEVDQAQAEVAAAEERRLQRLNQMQVASDADRIQAQQRLLTASERLAAADEKKLEILRAESEQLRASVERRQSMVTAAKELLKSEQEKTTDRSAAFGQKSQGEQAKLISISEKYRDGGGIQALSKSDIEYLRQSNSAPAIVREYDKIQGENSGALSFQANFGQRDDEDDAHSEYQRQLGNLATEQAQYETSQIAVQEQIRVTRDSIEAMNRLANAIEAATANGGSGPIMPHVNPEVTAIGISVENEVAAMGRSLIDAVRAQAEAAQRYRQQETAAIA
ncbi:hypothetical protein SH668x_001276 [Planctomicrobium sp. SH668]|uniref:hypothetical protein n=1 Tax=Planctomicrobium sp. SH668 TaxID=3448126 RepID=UPI003F5B09EC